MMKIFPILLLFWLISFGAAANDNCNPILESKEEVANYNYVIVPGIFDEIITAYMTEYETYLSEMGVPRDQIVKASNWSHKSPKESLAKIIKKIKTMPEDKELVFFSHSKGALETLYLLLSDEEIRDQTHQAVLIQGPFDGVSSHEIIYSEDETDEGGWMLSVMRFFAKPDFIKKRYDAFSKEEVRKNLNNDLMLDPNFLNKIIFVTGSKDVDNMRLRLRVWGNLYKEYYGEENGASDGVIRENEQVPHNINEELACVVREDADHRDLVQTGYIFASEKIKRVRRFIDRMLIGLGLEVDNSRL